MLSADATYSTTSVVEPRSLKSSRMSRFDKEDFPRRRITQAMTSLFILLTLENFPIYLEEAVAISPWALPFYLSYIFIVVFTVLNVLIGIVLNAMDEARQESKSRREQLKELNQIVHEVDEIATDGKVTDAELVTLKEKIKEMEAILKSQNKDLAD